MIYTTDANGKQVINFDYYDSIGIFLTKEGFLQSINENIYANYLCQTFDFVVRFEAQFFHYKDNYWQRLSDLKLKKILRNHLNGLVNDSWGAGIESQYLAALIRECRSSDELIPGDEYICLKNGLLHLDNDFKFQPHNKNVFTTTQIPVTYNENAEPPCELFKNFLRDVLENDDELISVVSEIMGYALCSHSKAHKFFLFYGSGRNGKSVLLNLVSALVGKENTTNIPLKSFNNSFELADIVDKKLNVSTENEGTMLNTEKLKMISAGDPILINPKNEKPFSYTPFVKLIFATNSLPKAIDTSDGFMERLLIVPFNKKFSYEPKEGEGLIDPELFDKLLKELDGIFVFALQGLIRLTNKKFRFTQSSQVTKALQQYQSIINPFVNFIKSELNIVENSSEHKSTVYKKFKLWASSQGYNHFANISARQFYLDFEMNLKAQNVTFAIVKINGNKSYKGFTVN